MEHAGAETTLSLPELGLLAGTRGMLGAGIGLLLADRLSVDQRKAVGWTLVIVGVLSTIPLGLVVLQGRKPKATKAKEPELRAA